MITIDETRVKDEIGLYYDMGFGVNQAEALRQDIAYQISIMQLNYTEDGLHEELETLYKDVEALSVLAGAKKLEEVIPQPIESK